MTLHEGSWRDNVPRRERYEAEHPEVGITVKDGIWTAVIPDRRPVIRVDLGRLLDVLEALDEPEA